MARGLRRIINAFGYSLQGFHIAWKSEVAFRQEVIALIIAIIIAFSLDFSVFERFFLLSSVLFVIIVELLNSAIEAIVDRISTEYHELSGKAKDYGSAAVFLAILITLFIWFAIFYRLIFIPL